MAKDKKNFEESMKNLEQIVDALERGELSLDESIDLFQKGIELSKYCSKRLDEIEKKITILVEDEKGGLVEEAFSTEDY